MPAPTAAVGKPAAAPVKVATAVLAVSVGLCMDTEVLFVPVGVDETEEWTTELRAGDADADADTDGLAEGVGVASASYGYT